MGNNKNRGKNNNKRKVLLDIDEEVARNAPTAAYLRNEKNGLCYAIPVGEWTIGRLKDITLDIPLKTDDQYISREQAVIILKKNHIGEFAMYIMDKMGKRNPTRINGLEIDHSVEYQLYDGDVIRMGKTPITVHLWIWGHNFPKKEGRISDENRPVETK